MLSFGSTDAHTNSLDFGDLDQLDGNVRYIVAFWAKQNTTAAASRWFFADGKLTVGSDSGFGCEGGSTIARIRHGGGGTIAAKDFTIDLTDGLTHSIVYAWRGTTGGGPDDQLRVYFDGVVLTEQTLANARSANTLAFILGNNTDKNNGYAYQFGHFMYWHNFFQTPAELDLIAATYHAGNTIPRPDKLTFWHKGLASPGKDEISGTVPTAGGTVTFSSDAIDAYYSSTEEQFRTIGSHRLLQRKSEEQLYTLTVPIGFSNIELMDLINISHDSLPLSASRITNINQGLVDKWKRLIGRATDITLDPLNRTIALKFRNQEPYMTTYWSTDQLPIGTNVLYNGLTRLAIGTVTTVDRAQPGYLEQENTLKIEVSQNLEGQFYKQAAAATEKMNHLGLLAEDAISNPILNNTASGSETSWTGTAGGGTLSLSTVRLAYPSAVTPRSFTFARTNNTGDTYRTQTFAVVSADTSRRLYITKTEEDNDSEVSWRLQRSTDSFFWNNTTPGWQSGTLWNTLSNSFASPLSFITREISKPITISANQNWTLDIGLNGATLPAGGGEVNVYSVSCLNSPLIYSEVPTTTAIITTIADTIKRVKTSGSQIVSATRGTFTLEMEAIQAGGDLVNGDRLCLYYWQYGTTAGADYDALIYEKQTAENARFSFIRFISSALDADSFKEVTIVPGTTYKITCVWTDDTNGELGVNNSLMRIFIDGVKGTDDFATANHSAAATHTELWVGCAPSATGYRRAMNYMRHARFWPRAFTDEEALQ